jgi:hypothetical protein
MAKRKVFTLNGSVPTATSAVYTEPLTITSSKKIRAATYDDATGRMSDVVTSFVRIIPSNYETQKYYCCHLMVSLGGFAKDHVSWIQSIKDQGYNLLWLHLEEFSATDNNYKDNKYLRQIMNACDMVGIAFMVGIVYGGSIEQKVKLFTDTWNRSSLFKIDGKRVYTDYFLFPTLITATRNALTALGMGDFYYWSGTTFPFNGFGTSSNWIDEQSVGDGDYTLWAFAQQEGTDSVEHVYDTRPFDGIIFFCGDNYDASHTVKTNRDINTVSQKMGKLAMGANMHFYSSSQYQDYGFSGTAQIWNDIMSLPPEERMQGVCDITANDYKESTYLSELSYPPVDGMAFIPPFNTGFTFGEDMRYPLLDHTGMQKFYRPWVDAYLSNAQAPVFAEDKLFCRYMLHPANVDPRLEVPYVFYDQSFISSAYWENTLYAKPDSYTSVAPVKYNGLNSEAIKVGAHLTSPAHLKINDVLSDLMPAGPAWFEIPLGSFRGTPRFAIVRNGQEVKYGYGEQDITDDPFPGGWGLLSTEVNPGSLETPEPVTVTVDTILHTITSSHPFGANEIEYSEGLRPWEPYVGPLNVGDFTYDVGFWRFRTKATTSRNAGIVVRTPAIVGAMKHGEEGEYLIWNKHISDGVIVDANGGWKTPSGATDAVGATAGKRLGGDGSWLQIELSKSLTDVRIFLQFSNNDDGDYTGGYYSSNIFFLDFGQFNPPGEPEGYRLASGMIIRMEASGNDVIVKKSYNNGVKFFGEVIIPGKLTGLTNPFIKVFTPAGNAQQVIVSTKGYGLI